MGNHNQLGYSYRLLHIICGIVVFLLQESSPLTYVSFIGCGISLLCLITAVFMIVLFR